MGQPGSYDPAQEHGQADPLCRLLDLPQTFGIYNILNTLAARNWTRTRRRSPTTASRSRSPLPDEFWERGVTEIKDIVKVIVSTSSFDARRLEQTDLDLPAATARPISRDTGLAGTLGSSALWSG